MAVQVRNLFSVALISIFAVLCALPGLVLLHFDGVTRSLVENRDLADLPPWPGDRAALAGWTTGFDRFVADHFGGRQRLVALYNYLHVAAGVSPIERALVGRDGWLFLEQTYLKDSNRGAMPLSDRELEALVDSFQRRRDFLADRGIEFIVMPVPDKNSLFPEFLPASVKFVGPSRLAQFRAALLDVNFHSVDVYDRLQRAKEQGEEIYFQTDSHWNSRGAWFAYLALMDALHELGYPGGTVLRETDVEFIRMDPLFPTDIVKNLLGLAGWIRENHGIRARVTDPGEVKAFRGSDGTPYKYIYPAPPGQEHKHYKRTTPRDGSRVLIYRDSYGNAMIPFLIHSFDEVIYLRPPKTMGFDPADIERYQPDLVIYEFVERGLLYRPDDLLLRHAAQGQGGIEHAK